MNLEKAVQNYSTLITVGSGGVGKTTHAINLAMLGAKAGKKVALISIDPAKRLADAIGLELGSQLKKIKLPRNAQIQGEIHAAMLDQETEFKNLVSKFARDKAQATKILNHSMFKATAVSLGGMIEYLALAKIVELHQTGGFELLVVDTPPGQHTLDFIKKPLVLNNFVNSNVMRWILKPMAKLNLNKKTSFFSINSLVNKTSNLLEGISKVVGVEAFSEFAVFFVLLSDVISALQKDGEKIKELLKSKDTGFVCVTTLNKPQFRITNKLLLSLQEESYRPAALIANKCLPEISCSLDSKLEQIYRQRKRLDDSILKMLEELNEELFNFEIPVIKVLDSSKSLENLTDINNI